MNSALESSTRLASHLYKLAIRNIQLSRRALPLGSALVALDELDSGVTASGIAQEFSSVRNTRSSGPLSEGSKIRYVSAARIPMMGQGVGLKLKVVFGPLQVRPPSPSRPIVDKVTTSLNSLFDSEGKSSVLFEDLRPEDKNPYRVETTTSASSSSAQYAIVYNGGPREGKLHKREYNKGGVRAYKNALFPTVTQAYKFLSELNTGIPTGARHIAPRSTSSFRKSLEFFVAYDVTIGKESPAFEGLDRLLSEVDSGAT